VTGSGCTCFAARSVRSVRETRAGRVRRGVCVRASVDGPSQRTGRRDALAWGAVAGASSLSWAGLRVGEATAGGEMEMVRGASLMVDKPSPAPEMDGPMEGDDGRRLDEITDTVFLDIALCDAGDPRARTLGATEVCPADASVVTSLGRLELGLYGNAAPVTVAAFKRAIQEQGAHAAGEEQGPGELFGLKGTKIHKVDVTYIAGGRRGPHRDGGVRMPPSEGVDGGENADLVSSRAFVLRHDKAGVLSLAVGENDEGGYAAGQRAPGSISEGSASRSSFPSIEFMITTAKAPALDGANVVFGRVTSGLGTLLKVAAVPTYRPKSSRVGGINSVASLLGDERAEKAKASWTKPMKTIVVLDCGLVS